MRATIYSLTFAVTSQPEQAAMSPSPPPEEAASAAVDVTDASSSAAGAQRSGDDESAQGRARAASGGGGTLASSNSRRASRRARSGPLLCATSSTGTVHVWRCAHQSGPQGGSSTDASGEGEGEVRSEGDDERGGPSRSASGRRASGGFASATSSGLASLHKLLGSATAAAQAERDVAHVRLKPQTGATWCVAALREELPAAAAAAESAGAPSAVKPRCSLYVLTQKGEFFRYELDPASGTCSLQDERRLLAAQQ